MTYGTKGEPVRCLVSVGPMTAAKASSEGWRLRLRPNKVTATLPTAPRRPRVLPILLPPAARTQVVASGTGSTTDTRPIVIQPVTNVHSMCTRGKAGIPQLVDRLNLHAVLMSPLPRSVRDALSEPNWRSAMQAEYYALIVNDTWSLVPRPPCCDWQVDLSIQIACRWFS
jgi:hypothetical protein